MSLEQFAQLDFSRDLQQAFLSPLTVEEFDVIGITVEYDRSLELFRRLFCPDVSFHAIVPIVTRIDNVSFMILTRNYGRRFSNSTNSTLIITSTGFADSVICAER
jgi:hypothetical protein